MMEYQQNRLFRLMEDYVDVWNAVISFLHLASGAWL